MRTVARGLGLAAVLAPLSAAPVFAETWWMGSANPGGLALIDFDKITTDAQGRRTAVERVLTPRGTVIEGKQVAVVIAHHTYDCQAETIHLLGGNAVTQTAEIVAKVPPEAAAKPLAPKSTGWRLMKLVCADSDAERSRYGSFVGEADFASLIERMRPPAGPK